MRYPTLLLAALLLLPFATARFAQADDTNGVAGAGAAKQAPQPEIQLALLLDTSNSMDGLIDQAKTQLWKVVNELVTARQNGRAPRLSVALYEYGNNGLAAENGYIRRVLPLTDDLDMVSEQLFALKTNGGHEFCGQVIGLAVADLEWSASQGVYRTIFISGNEPFSQGSVDFRVTCKAAAEKGLTVNTIFCGPRDQGIASQWQTGAALTDGRYINIDQNKELTHIEAPQDKEIARLGVELNKTYLAYGKAGKESQKRQQEQDCNADKQGKGSSMQRARWKASCGYSNGAWDLIDATRDKKVKIEDLKDEQLPEIMRKMSMAERKAHIEKLRAERARIQKAIQELDTARKAHVAEALKKAAVKGVNTLDEAMLGALRKQAEKRSFKFGE